MRPIGGEVTAVSPEQRALGSARWWVTAQNTPRNSKQHPSALLWPGSDTPLCDRVTRTHERQPLHPRALCPLNPALSPGHKSPLVASPSPQGTLYSTQPSLVESVLSALVSVQWSGLTWCLSHKPLDQCQVQSRDRPQAVHVPFSAGHGFAPPWLLEVSFPVGPQQN